MNRFLTLIQLFLVCTSLGLGITPAGAEGEAPSTAPKKVKVFYRWGPPQDIEKLVQDAHLTPENIQPFLTNYANFKGDGLYLAESPITSDLWGTAIVEVWVDQELIDADRVFKFGGVGKDWWLAQIDSIMEDAGIDADNPSPSDLKKIGITYKKFEGANLDRSQMEKIIELTKEGGKEGVSNLVAEVLNKRTYKWSCGAGGEVSCLEYTESGRLVASTLAKYCPQETLETYKNKCAEKDLEAGEECASAADATVMDKFNLDLEDLANKSFLFRAWTGFFHLREAVKDVFSE